MVELELLRDATTTNMPVNFECVCVFIEIFVDRLTCAKCVHKIKETKVGLSILRLPKYLFSWKSCFIKFEPWHYMRNATFFKWPSRIFVNFHSFEIVFEHFLIHIGRYLSHDLTKVGFSSAQELQIEPHKRNLSCGNTNSPTFYCWNLILFTSCSAIAGRKRSVISTLNWFLKHQVWSC